MNHDPWPDTLAALDAMKLQSVQEERFRRQVAQWHRTQLLPWLYFIGLLRTTGYIGPRRQLVS